MVLETLDNFQKTLSQKNMRKVKRSIPYIVLFAMSFAVFPGCEMSPQNARVLPMPAIEQPPANIPSALHQRNWTGRIGQGSCVHASLTSHLRWLNMHEMGERWRATYSDGEYDSRLRQRLDAADVDYVFTLKADPRFLDWASDTRRGAILWWKPSHCCTFVGFVEKDGEQFAAILDNNRVGNFELTPREQFVRLWAGYGGFALTVANDPAGSIPYRSYEVF